MSWLSSFWKRLSMPSEDPHFNAAEYQHNFTPRAQQALALARKEADRFNHNFLGTEHVLLGLIKLGQGVAVNVLKKMGVDLETARREVEHQIGKGPDQKIFGNIPYTPRVKQVLALATKESKALNHTYVGTEHILLGLLREGDGAGARVLINLGVDIEKARQEVLKELDPNFEATAPGAEPPALGTAPGPTQSTTPHKTEPTLPPIESIDTSKRYDIYCAEREQEVVVYRNARFKGTRALFLDSPKDLFSQFVEIEQADGRTIFVARYSVIKFCDPGTTPGSEPVPGMKP
jgi:hypothetical protein